MLFDKAKGQLISSFMLSEGDASSGWLLVEVGERYIEAGLVKASLHKINKTRQFDTIMANKCIWGEKKSEISDNVSICIIKDCHCFCFW
jgi:hypothetical protein